MAPNNDKLRRRDTGDSKSPGTQNQTTKANRIATQNELRNATSSTTHRLWLRTVVVLALMTLVYFYGLSRKNKEISFALVRENIPLRMQKFECHPDYETEVRNDYPDCAPKKCGRFVSDRLVDPQETKLLLQLASRVMSKVGSAGGASILDIHTGALSYKKQFINAYTVPDIVSEFRPEYLQIYSLVKAKIKLAIAEQFGISPKMLHLTYPTFFSRLMNATAQTVHDEYWNEHVDKETYPSFHYTSLLYLNTHGKDFNGGRFIFVNGSGENRTTAAIEPKAGRVLAFTSGAENPHHVEKVENGERYAVTISFTCNSKLGITNPEFPTEQLKSEVIRQSI